MSGRLVLCPALCSHSMLSLSSGKCAGGMGRAGTVTAQCTDHTVYLVGTSPPCGRDGAKALSRRALQEGWTQSSTLKESSSWLPGGIEEASGAGRAKVPRARMAGDVCVFLGNRVCVWTWGQETLLSLGACSFALEGP